MDINWHENFLDLDTGIPMIYMTYRPVDGPPLIFIHGTTDSRFSWSQLVPILASVRYRCCISEMQYKKLYYY